MPSPTHEVPEESNIRLDKSKADERANEQAHVNASFQSVMNHETLTAPFVYHENNARPVEELEMIRESKLYAQGDVFTMEAAPPEGKGGGNGGGGKNKNQSPDAVDDSASTDVDTETTFDVLANDSDPDGDTLTVVGNTDPSNGSVVDNGDGTFTYTPDAGFEGVDTFTYTIDDGKGGTDTATVEVTVGTPPVVEPGATNYIEALTFDDINRWNWQDPVGTATEVTYTFLEYTPDYYHPSSTENRGFQAFNAEQQGFTRDMLDVLEGYANVTFTETVLADAQITYGYADLGRKYAGWAYIPDGDDGIMEHSGDIWLNVDYGQDLTPGTYYGMAVMHETGHAIGLAHPFDGVVLDDPETENRGYTMMSYDADPYGGMEPVTPMLYDIAAMQYLYGANMSTNAGDTTYDLSDPAYFGMNWALWDASGNDTLDGSAIITDLTLNLNDGAFSSVGLENSMAIAFDAVIENANGGAGNDVIVGNEADNVLMGGSGMDILSGGAGNDSLYYDGEDVLDGGVGNDTMVALYETVLDTSSNLLSSIESMDFGNALADIVNVVLSDILDLSDNDDLYILGDSGIDTVNVAGGANNGVVNVGGVDYAHYADGATDLFVQSDLIINETGVV